MIDEDTFLSTLASMQQEVKLEKQDQNVLVQKLANITSTGDDNVSYKKALEKISKKQIEEIGTLRTQGRPLNIVKEEQFKLQDEIGQLEEFKEKQYEIEELKQNLEDEIVNEEEKLKLIKELKQVKDKEKIDSQKIEFNKNIINSNNEKIDILEKEKEKKEQELKEIQPVKKEESKKTKNTLSVVCAIIAIIFVVLAIVFKDNTALLITMCILAGASFIGTIISFIMHNKNINRLENKVKKEINNANAQKQEIQNEINIINSQIELLEKSNEEQERKIYEQENEISNKNKNEIQRLQDEYGIEVDYNNLANDVNTMQESINKLKLELHTLELDKNNITPKLEKLSQMEEELEELNEREKSLISNNESFELAKEVLQKAYTKMKENVTPKFTENLSKNIEKISNGKYKNVKINDEEGIIVEKENGEYVSCEKLSIGTIDQLYMSLRFGAIKELSSENMPIILDESFAYYDEERLENILKYINSEFNKNQIIIFTCTNREKEAFDKLNIEYNVIEL